MSKTVVILATLDTKGREAAFMADLVRARGHRPLLIDVGVMGEPAATADIDAAKVAEAGGTSLEALRAAADREQAAPAMALGAERLLRDLIARGETDAVVALGGTQGTTLATGVMRSLPYGFPKLMVSTMASGNVAPWVGISDIAMLPSVTDIMGLNPFMRRILANAVGAVCGMAEVVATEVSERARPLIAVTTVGITTQGAMTAVGVLEAAGYETIVFHAVGTGGRAMEAMMRHGLIAGVLDFSTIEVSNEMYSALLAGGPDRLTTAGAFGLPQVLCPGAIEVLVFNEPETVPAKYSDRRLVRHSPKITDLRLNAGEMAAVGREVATRLQTTHDPAVFLIPTGGYDSYATAGGAFHDPEADAAFVAALRRDAPSCVEIVERAHDINAPAFATEAAERLIALLRMRAA